MSMYIEFCRLEILILIFFFPPKRKYSSMANLIIHEIQVYLRKDKLIQETARSMKNTVLFVKNTVHTT